MLKFGNAWQIEKGGSPHIAGKYSRRYGLVKIKLIFTTYAVPILNDETELKNFLKSMHPQVDKLEVLKVQKCQSKLTNCYLAQIYISRFEKKHYINYLYFVHNNSAFLGFSQVNGISDNLIVSDLIEKELANAVAN